MKPIRYVETTEAPFVGEDDTFVLRIDPSRRVTLRFQLELKEPDVLEALRYARRAMIREERTRGLQWDEPSIEEATFTKNEIRWFVLASQAAWCRQKIVEVVERANRAREAMRKLGTRPTATPEATGTP